MSDKFMDLLIKGEVGEDEIDDFIDDWHDGDSTEHLHTYLGMTYREYKFWLTTPTTLQTIIKNRLKESNRDKIKDIRRDQDIFEKTFYDKWMQNHANRTDKAYTTLEYLLAEDVNEPRDECADRDEYVASVVIQWLGSPVGRLFLRDCGFVNAVG